MILISPPDNTVVADTAAAVFRALARPVVPLSAWERFTQWLMFQLLRLIDLLLGHSGVGAAIRTGFWTIVLIAAIWVAVTLVVRSQQLYTQSTKFRRQRAQDYWLLAQQLAAKAQYSEAAHALYLGLLHGLAQQRYVVVHDAKTIGDYVREVRKKAPSATYARFAEFARSYETIVYRLQYCDAPRYAQLFEIASHLLQHDIDAPTQTAA